jgi:hypothetical protein
VDFFDDAEINAFACIKLELGLIGISRGAILLPNDIIIRMLSHPNVLRAVGDPGKEIVLPEHGDGLSANWDQLIGIREKTGRSIRPNGASDPVRREFARLAAHIQSAFLTFHELAHILYGHTLCFGAQSGCGAMLEAFQEPPHTTADAIIHQGLEVFADYAAAQCGISSLLNFTGDVPEPITSIYSTPQQRLFLWCFAIAALFWTWGITVDVDDLSRATHPPTAMRYQILINGARDWVKDAFPELFDGFMEICGAAQEQLNLAVGEIGGVPIGKTNIAGLYDPAFVQHRHQIFACMRETLLPELDKWSYLSAPKLILVD